MTAETATYISELDKTKPDPMDITDTGDDHLRLIKSVLKNQFPNFENAALEFTATELNNIFSNNNLAFTGLIINWNNSLGSIPTGWVLCDGTNGTPDLRDKFIIVSGDDFPAGNTGGSFDIDATETDEHVLTIDEMPAHDHTYSNGAEALMHDVNGSNYSVSDNTSIGVSSSSNDINASTGFTGGGQGHKHDININPDANIPPYYAMYKIMKV